MSSTATATTSPTRLQHHREPLVPGGPLLTASVAAPGAASSEPLPKRQRLEARAQDSLERCLRTQVRPHVDSAIAKLPRNRVNELEIRKRVRDLAAAMLSLLLFSPSP